MSTTKSTQSSIQYSPTGMNAYNGLIPQAAGVLGDFMKDPLQSTGFSRNLGMQQKFINQAGQARQQNILGNQAALGMAGRPMSGFAQSQSANQARLTTGEGSNAFTNLLNYANQQRLAAGQTASAFQPLQTGQSTTEKTSGLGTWLPQLIGAAGGMAMNAFMPGAGIAAGAAKGAAPGIGALSKVAGGSGFGNYSAFSNFMPTNAPSFNAYSLGRN